MKTFDVMKNYKLWFIFSGAVITVGIVMMLFSGLNLGIDFTGGTMMQIDLGKEVTVNEVSEAIAEFDLNPDIVHSGADRTEVIIKTQASLDNDMRSDVFETLKKAYNLEDSALKGTDQYGPSMGKEIRNRAIISILIASVVMLLYISIRFETVFGVSAIISLIHDVLFLLSIYAIFGITINSSFIAAILTIVGYSINDTIVVFDRVRENVKREKGKPHFEIINISVNQTLTRTINTSMTTLVVIAALYFFGVSSIKAFALPLLIGITVGTYSSVFIASPVWALVRNYLGKRHSYAGK
ncbi:MAG TPA: protein translocase subunit SecF [Clostridiales bacterium UBA8960]|jgi:preprotein translocase SecF subunit|nr:protein translocase subunit SecF [Clostridiales bacterium UBA8960]